MKKQVLVKLIGILSLSFCLAALALTLGVGLNGAPQPVQAQSDQTLAPGEAAQAQADQALAPGKATSYPATGCRVVKHAMQSLANGQQTALTFEAQVNGTAPGDDCWSPAQPTRLYAREDGYYMAGGAVTLNPGLSRSGRMTVIVRKGGKLPQWIQAQGAHLHTVDDTIYSVSTGMFYLSAGEYVEIVVYHTLGSNIKTYQNTTCEHCVNGWLTKLADPALGCRVVKHTMQSLANGKETALAFEDQVNDSTPGDDCWSSAQPTRLYAQEDGYYMAGGALTLNPAGAAASGKIVVAVRRGNGQRLEAQGAHLHILDDTTYSTTGGMFYMSAGEYVEVVVYHTLGGGIKTYQNTTCQHCVNGWLVKLADPAMGCRVAMHAAQTLASGQETALGFDEQINDTAPDDDCWSPDQPTRLYAREDGYYAAGGAVTFNPGLSRSGKATVIVRRGGISPNWIQAQATHLHTIDDTTYSATGGMFYMNAGEYVEIAVYHTLGKGIKTYPNTTCQHCVNGWLTKLDGAPMEPQAIFEAAPLSGTAPLAVTFVNSSTHATRYVWDWGDGLSSTVASPTHTYALPGVYTVSLTASGPGGSHTWTRPNYITASAPVEEMVWVMATDSQASEALSEPAGGPSEPVEPLGEPAEFTISRTHVTDRPLAVNYILVGSAQNGLDYQTISTTAIIPAHAAAVIVTIMPLDDALVEPPESAQLRLEASPAYSLSYQSDQFPIEAVAIIADNEDNVPPRTFEISLTLVKNHTGTLNLADLGVYDPNQDMLAFRLEQIPSQGLASIDGHTLSYTPHDGYVGEDSLTYLVQDGQKEQASGSVLIHVVEPALNKAPVVYGRAFNVRGNTPLAIDLQTLTRDPEGGDLTYRIKERAQRGYSYLQGATLIYEPTLTLTQTDTVVYEVNDPEGQTTQATLILRLTPETSGDMNHPPLVNQAWFMLDQGDDAFQVDLNQLAFDPDGDALSYNLNIHPHGLITALSGPVVISETGSIELDGSVIHFTPEPGFQGHVFSTLMVRDVRGAASEWAQLVFEVRPAVQAETQVESNRPFYLSIEPAAALFTAVGETRTFRLQAYNALNKPVPVMGDLVAWRPVMSDGAFTYAVDPADPTRLTATAVAEVGYLQLRANWGTVESRSAGLMVAQLKPGVVRLPDEAILQLTGEPGLPLELAQLLENVEDNQKAMAAWFQAQGPDYELPNWRKAVLESQAADTLAAGTLVIAGSQDLAGRVVRVTVLGNGQSEVVFEPLPPQELVARARFEAYYTVPDLPPGALGYIPDAAQQKTGAYRLRPPGLAAPSRLKIDAGDSVSCGWQKTFSLFKWDGSTSIGSGGKNSAGACATGSIKVTLEFGGELVLGYRLHVDIGGITDIDVKLSGDASASAWASLQANAHGDFLAKASADLFSAKWVFPAPPPLSFVGATLKLKLGASASLAVRASGSAHASKRVTLNFHAEASLPADLDASAHCDGCDLKADFDYDSSFGIKAEASLDTRVTASIGVLGAEEFGKLLKSELPGWLVDHLPGWVFRLELGLEAKLQLPLFEAFYIYDNRLPDPNLLYGFGHYGVGYRLTVKTIGVIEKKLLDKKGSIGYPQGSASPLPPDPETGQPNDDYCTSQGDHREGVAVYQDAQIEIWCKQEHQACTSGEVVKYYRKTKYLDGIARRYFTFSQLNGLIQASPDNPAGLDLVEDMKVMKLQSAVCNNLPTPSPTPAPSVTPTVPGPTPTTPPNLCAPPSSGAPPVGKSQSWAAPALSGALAMAWATRTPTPNEDQRLWSAAALPVTGPGRAESYLTHAAPTPTATPDAVSGGKGMLSLVSWGSDAPAARSAAAGRSAAAAYQDDDCWEDAGWPNKRYCSMTNDEVKNHFGCYWHELNPSCRYNPNTGNAGYPENQEYICEMDAVCPSPTPTTTPEPLPPTPVPPQCGVEDFNAPDYDGLPGAPCGPVENSLDEVGNVTKVDNYYYKWEWPIPDSNTEYALASFTKPELLPLNFHLYSYDMERDLFFVTNAEDQGWELVDETNNCSSIPPLRFHPLRPPEPTSCNVIQPHWSSSGDGGPFYCEHCFMPLPIVSEPLKDTKVSKVFGDPHVTTFDGARFTSLELGEFIYARDTDASPGMGVELQVRQERLPGFPQWASFATAAAARAGGHVFEVRLLNPGASNSRLELLVDGHLTDLAPGLYIFGAALVWADQDRSITIAVGDTRVLNPGEYAGGGLTRIRLGHIAENLLGSSGQPAISLDVSMSVAPLGLYRGLLGTPDDNRDNEFQDRYGRRALSFRAFHAAWRIVDPDESLFTYADDQGPWSYNQPQTYSLPDQAALTPYTQQAEAFLSAECGANVGAIDPSFIQSLAVELAAGRSVANLIASGVCHDEHVQGAGQPSQALVGVNLYGRVTAAQLPGIGLGGARVLIRGHELGNKVLCDFVSGPDGYYQCAFTDYPQDYQGLTGPLTLNYRATGLGAPLEITRAVTPPSAATWLFQPQDLTVAPNNLLHLVGRIYRPGMQPAAAGHLRLSGTGILNSIYAADNGGNYSLYVALPDGIESGHLTYEAADAGFSHYVQTVKPFDLSLLTSTALHTLTQDLYLEAPAPPPAWNDPDPTSDDRMIVFSGQVQNAFVLAYNQSFGTDLNVNVSDALVTIESPQLADGSCQASSDAKGRYTCAVRLESAGPLTATLRVEQVGSTVVTLTLDAGDIPAAGQVGVKATNLRVSPTTFLLTGAVTAPDNSPLPGVQVAVTSPPDGQGHMTTASGLADGTGHYTLTLNLPNTVSLGGQNHVVGALIYTVINQTFSGPLLYRQALDLADLVSPDSPPAGQLSTISHDLQFNGYTLALTGRVRNEWVNDMGVPGARVVIDSQTHGVLCDTTTDDLGYYACDAFVNTNNPFPATYLVSQYGTLSETVILDPAGASPGTRYPLLRTLYVWPTTLHIRGLVRNSDNNQPVAGATVHLSVEHGGSAVVSSDGTGNYEGYLILDNSTVIDTLRFNMDYSSPTGHASGADQLGFWATHNWINHIVWDLSFSLGEAGLDPSHIGRVQFSGRLRNANTGLALPGANVSVQGIGGSAGEGSVCTAVSDGNGNYTCAGTADPDRPLETQFQVAYQASLLSGVTPLTATWQVIPGAAFVNEYHQDLSVSPTTLQLSGKIVELTARPLWGAEFRALSPWPGGATSTNAQGEYWLYMVLPNGPWSGDVNYQATFAGLQTGGSQPFVIPPDNIGGVTALPPLTIPIPFTARSIVLYGSITNTVVAQARQDIPVELRTPGGQELCRTATSSSGEYTCRLALSNGDPLTILYTVDGQTTDPFSGEVYSMTLSSDHPDLAYRLPPAGEERSYARNMAVAATTAYLSGTVRDEAGAPVPEAALQASGAFAGQATAAADGTYSLYAVIPFDRSGGLLDLSLTGQYLNLSGASTAPISITARTLNTYTRDLTLSALPAGSTTARTLYVQGRVMSRQITGISTYVDGALVTVASPVLSSTCQTLTAGDGAYNCRLVVSDTNPIDLSIQVGKRGAANFSTQINDIPPVGGVATLVKNMVVTPTLLSLHGTLRNEQGGGLANATVTVDNRVSGQTGSDGGYSLAMFVDNGVTGGDLTYHVQAGNQNLTFNRSYVAVAYTLNSIEENIVMAGRTLVFGGQIVNPLRPGQVWAGVQVDVLSAGLGALCQTVSDASGHYQCSTVVASANPFPITYRVSGVWGTVEIDSYVGYLPPVGGSMEYASILNVSPTTLRLKGVVKASNGVPLRGAQVDVSGDVTAHTQANAAGGYEVYLYFSDTYTQANLSVQATYNVQSVTNLLIPLQTGQLTVYTQSFTLPIEMPSMQVTPGAIEETLTTGVSRTVWLTISNMGNSTLNWDIRSSRIAVSETFDAGFPSGFSLHSSASHNSSQGKVYLTTTGGYQRGGLFYDQLIQTDYLKVNFDFEISSGSGADGMALVFLNSIALGNSGGALGFYGSGASGWGIEFDTYANSGESENHIAVTSAGESTFVTNNGIPELENTGPFSCEVVFDRGHLEMYLENASIGYARTKVIDYTFASITHLDSYIGFTAATGGATNNHIVDNLALSTGSWLSVSPLSGAIAASSETSITIALDATDLISDTYYGSITINSNEPFTPTLTVPVTLHVTDALNVSVAPPVDGVVDALLSLPKEARPALDKRPSKVIITGRWGK